MPAADELGYGQLMAEPDRLSIPLPDGSRVSAALYRAEAQPIAMFALAHGAGAGQTHPFIVRAARGLAARGIDVLTFNFPYVEQRRRVPDPAPRLEACCRAAAAEARRLAQPGCLMIAGGKSMGGRIASQVAAGPGSEDPLDGLVFLGYPLHPPGRPHQLRAAHLGAVHVPMLFVQGARDPFGTPGELNEALARVQARATVHVVPDGDHSFGVPKGAGRSPGEVERDVFDEIIRWIRSLE